MTQGSLETRTGRLEQSQLRNSCTNDYENQESENIEVLDKPGVPEDGVDELLFV